MKITLLSVLPLFIAIRQCHALAVTWRTIGCEDWTFNGVSIDTIWDNAYQMSLNAQSQIGTIPTGLKGILPPNTSRAGANAKFMFGVKFSRITGLDSAGKTTMETVNNIYSSIQEALEGTLRIPGTPVQPGFDVNNAFLFCEANGLQYGTFPNNPASKNVWFAQLTTNGVTEYIVLNFKLNENVKITPCTETGTETDPKPGTNKYQAKAFEVTQIIGNQQNLFLGIILCPTQFPENAHPVPTLAAGFTTTGNNPNPDQYISISGALLHEVTHVVSRSRGAIWEDKGYLFNQCLNLANTDQASALKNPDNYRIFADMSMSPLTKWQAPNPAPNPAVITT